MEPVQEGQETPWVESDNQQNIFRWVRNNLNLPSVQGQTYTVWELCQACERKILYKSSYSEIIGEIGVPKSSITF